MSPDTPQSNVVQLTRENAVSAAPPATRELGAWVAALTFDDIPAKAVEHAKRCLLDLFGCGLYGARQPWGDIAADVACELAGNGPSTLWAHGRRTGPAEAAMANGTAAHGFEIDDIHVSSSLHPGSVTIPAALAIGEARKLTGRDLITAVVAGYEVGIRIGICASIQHKMKGFHITGTGGSIAAAAAAAKALKLADEACADALGLAATQAAGLYSARKGAMAKRFHAGRAAQSGVISGYLAEKGFTGSKEAIETPFGGFMSSFSENADLSVLTRDLSEHWHILDTGFKAYSSCASSHTTIDCIDTLMRDGLTADTLDKLTIYMTKTGLTNVGWEYKPVGIVGAQMNGYFVSSLKLLDDEVFINQFTEERIRDPKILAFMKKIEIVHDPELDAGGATKRHKVRVHARLKDGTEMETTREQRRGSFQHPLSDEEIRTKFHRTAGAILPADSVDRLMAAVGGLETAKNLDELGTLLRG
jgi:2-methylcitrate dehydratase PrpD